MKIIEEIIVALIGTIVTGVVVYVWNNRKHMKVIARLKLLVSIRKSGMTHFFYNKDMLRKQLGTVGEEIGRATKQFIYIGYTMSDVVRQDMEEAVVKAINERRVNFIFCILDEKSECANLYAEYTGREIEQIKVSLKDTDKAIKNIKKRLPDDRKEYIKLLKHDMFIPSSCFLGDIEEETGWIHFNYKAPKAIKFQDFGFVLSVDKEREFYENMKESYLAMLEDIYKYNNYKGM